MAHESFEDEATARVMNELFVNIKVDREERPDIDQIYMNALHLLGEQGGWPLTMFLTPRAEPCGAVLIFRKNPASGVRLSSTSCSEVARLFREEPARIEQNRAALLARLADKARPAGKVTIGLKELDAAAMQIGNMFDPSMAACAARQSFRNPQSSKCSGAQACARTIVRFFETVEHSLERMCEGGIYDHLGGGFSRVIRSTRDGWCRISRRCSTTTRNCSSCWRSRCSAAARCCSPGARAKRSTWLAREMTTGEGAFAASLDADSEGEEGKFYVWSHEDVIKVLGTEDGEYFAHHYDVTPGGNFEGHSILNRLQTSPAH